MEHHQNSYILSSLELNAGITFLLRNQRDKLLHNTWSSLQFVLKEYELYAILMYLYHHKTIIPKSFCFLIYSCVGYLNPLYVCHDILCFDWISYY